MNRRTFIQTAGLFAAGPLILPRALFGAGAPSKKIIEEVIDEVVVGKVVEEVEGTSVVVADGPVPGTIAENEAALPPYPQKGSKRPPKRSDD